MRYTLQIPAVGDADAEIYEGVTYGELRNLEARIKDLQRELRIRDWKNSLLKVVTVDRIGIHFNPSEEYISHPGGKKLTEVLLEYVKKVEDTIGMYRAA